MMLTGDSRKTAQAVGKKLGLDEIVAEVLPADKAAAVKRLQAEGRFVAMAGDGCLGIPLAAGVLYPFFGLLLTPVMAAAMAFSSVSVTGNALRLRRART